jgi:hypothetical protein
MTTPGLSTNDGDAFLDALLQAKSPKRRIAALNDQLATALLAGDLVAARKAHEALRALES